MMMRQLQQIVVGILLASSLLCLLQRCDAAAPFSSLSSRRAIVPQLSQHDASEDVTKNTSSSITSLGDDEDDYNLKPRSSSSSYYKRLKLLRGGNNILLLSSSPSSFLSTITTIVAQTLNVATAAIVGSGYLGCYIASLIINRLQQYCQLSDNNHISNNNDGSNNIVLSLLQGKWKWTILASISHILINNFQNPSFVPTLWIYSYMVNSTLGGLIGCTHVLLGGISSLLGSQVVINRVSDDLMNIRLPPLDEDGNMSYDVNTFLKSREEESKSVVVIRDGLVRFLSSLSILTSFPQDCLSLYLGICAFLSWASTVDLSNNVGMVWKVVSEKWIPWWSDGLFGKVGGGEGAATAATAMVVDTKTLSMRLFALHLIIMLVKGMTALLLQL